MRILCSLFILSIIVMTFNCSIFNSLNASLCNSDDVDIEIFGGGRLWILLNDTRENPSENLLYKIWVNFTFLIRPILRSKSLYHFYFEGDVNSGKWILIGLNNPLKLAIGCFSVKIFVGGAYENATGFNVGTLLLIA